MTIWFPMEFTWEHDRKVPFRYCSLIEISTPVTTGPLSVFCFFFWNNNEGNCIKSIKMDILYIKLLLNWIDLEVIQRVIDRKEIEEMIYFSHTKFTLNLSNRLTSNRLVNVTWMSKTFSFDLNELFIVCNHRPNELFTHPKPIFSFSTIEFHEIPRLSCIMLSTTKCSLMNTNGYVKNKNQFEIAEVKRINVQQRIFPSQMIA